MPRPISVPPHSARILPLLAMLACLLGFGLVPGSLPGEETEAAEAVSPDEAPVFLRVLASRHDGMPAAGVAFRVVIDAEEEQRHETNARGLVRLPIPRAGVSAIVTIDDGDWFTTNPRQRYGGDARPLFFTVFPSDGDAMGTEEREAFAQTWWRRIVQELEAASLADPARRTLTPAMRHAAFLNGMRRESPEQMLLFDDEARNGPAPGALRVRLVHPAGTPVVGERVDLYTFRDDEVAIRLSGFARTNGDGIATFPAVPRDVVMRAEARTGDGRVARSSFLRPSARGADSPPVPMVLHPDADSLSGIIVNADGSPASGVMVEILRGPERTLMRRLVDEDGYFHFAPVPGGADVRVRLTAPGGGVRHQIVLPAEPREREWLIPLSVIRPAAERPEGQP